MTKKKSAQRYDKNQRQEDVSRYQFARRISQFGEWLLDDIKRDLGEDFLIRIYEAGVWTGITFYVQLKSTQDVENYLVAKSFVSFGLEVKDLLHWGHSAIPIVIVIWDVNRELGYWITAWDAIAWLNEHRSGWQEKEKVRVRIPLSKETSDSSLNDLRAYLSEYFLPIIQQENTLDGTLHLSFPTTGEGKKKIEAVQRFFDYGDTLVLDEQYIEEFRFSDWYVRLKGTTQPKQIILETPLGEIIPTRIDAISPSGSVTSLPYVALQKVREGAKESVVSNEKQPTAIHISFSLNRELIEEGEIVKPADSSKSVLSMRLSTNMDIPLNVQDMKEGYDFIDAAYNAAFLRLTSWSNGKVGEFPVPQRQSNQINNGFADLLDRLCFIQRILKVRITVTGWHIDEEVAQEIDEVFEIVTTGRLDLESRVHTFSFPKATLEIALKGLETEQALVRSLEATEVIYELLGSRLMLGPAKVDIIAVPQIEPIELKNIIEKLNEDESYTLPYYVYKGGVDYKNWTK